MRQQSPRRVLGVDPKLVFVFELGAAVDTEEFRRAGLRVLDGSDRRLVVAFADDPQLAGFKDRLDACAGGVPIGARSEPYAGLIDAIDTLRPLAASDRMSPELVQVLSQRPPADELRLDVQLWHPDDRALAATWAAELRGAATEAGGRVADVYVNDQAGLILARVYIPADAVLALAELDTIAVIDVLPRPTLTVPQLYARDPVTLPAMPAPRDGAPLVGLIDSGVASAHPLVGPAVVATESLSPAISDGEDRCGHGTMVAGRILHGRVDQAIASGMIPRPFCRILSVAVLDAKNNFPEAELWERDLVTAIEWCATNGATIINLSVGDRRRPMQSPRQLPAAALVDEVARRHDLVVVIAAGNVAPADYLDTNDIEELTGYPAHLLADKTTRILDPATSALGLTVGGLTEALAAGGYLGRETAARVPLGEPGWPSPVTRLGPGVAKAVKPELVEHAGTVGIESGRFVDNDPEMGVISTRLEGARLLGSDLGTSFAAPLVTRVAAAVKARHPGFSANQVRALVLLSAEPPGFADVLVGGAPAQRAAGERHLLGYGRPVLANAIESTTHRAVLIAEAAMSIDGVHIYELPVPSSFFEPGGDRGLDLALAYNPRTRLSRLDYLSTRMDFAVFRGMPLDEVTRAVARVAGDEDVILEEEAIDRDPETGSKSSQPPTVSELGSRVAKLSPASSVRSAGANQVGRITFPQRWDRRRHTPVYLVVRNVNRWEDDTTTQSYALAVAIWRSEDHRPVYAELEAQLEAVAEVAVEIELES